MGVIKYAAMRINCSPSLRFALRHLAAGLFMIAASPSLAQQTAPPPASTPVKEFTVQQAVEYALANYPAVRAALEQYNAAKAGVGLAQTNYLPRLDGVWQGD